jgi:ABC-type antimicrobial peptide transport system permease subunit
MGRSLTTLLYGVEPTDAATIVGAASVVFLMALFACWRPALRAARVDPLVALKYE